MAAALLPWGCSATERLALFLEAEDGVVVVAALNTNGHPVRTSPSRTLREGRWVEGGPPELVLKDDEPEAVVLYLPLADAEAALPGLITPTTDLRFGIGPIPAPTGGAPPSPFARWSSRPAPEVTEAWRILADQEGRRLTAEERGPIAAPIQIAGWLDPEYCRSRLGPLLPYADTDLPLAGWVRKARRIRVAGPDQVLVADEDQLFVVRRGQAFVPTGVPPEPTNLLPVGALEPTARAAIVGAAVAPDGAGGWRVWVATGVDTRRDPPLTIRQGVHELHLGDQGLTVIATATRSEGPSFRDLALAPDGTLALTRDDDAVVFRDPRDGHFRLTRFAPSTRTLDDTSRRIVALDDPRTPFLATTEGQIHRYRAREDRWDLEVFVLPSSDAPDFLSIATVPGSPGPEAWIGGAGLYRSIGGPFTQEEPSPPPRYAACALEDPPRYLDSVTGLAVDGEALYAASLRCNAVIGVRRSDNCTFMVTPSEGVERREGAYDLAFADGALYFLSTDGRILISRP